MSNLPSLPADYALPEVLKAEIDQSVQRFEEQWGALKSLAKSNGWLELYRKEVTALVVKAYQAGVEVMPGLYFPSPSINAPASPVETPPEGEPHEKA